MTASVLGVAIDDTFDAMVESWRTRLKRQSREIDGAVRALFARPPADDRVLLDRLDALAQEPLFQSFTWSWGPELARRSRVFFRPFTLSHFSRFAVNAKGEAFDAWKGEPGAALQRWFEEVDRADDVELTRRLYGWRLDREKSREKVWQKDLLERFSRASSPAARFTALSKVDIAWLGLDAKTALALYEIDAVRARAFVLNHLPWFGWGTAKRSDWDALLERSRSDDAEFHFDLYRRVVEEKRWRADVLELARSVRDAAALDSELERRHPRGVLANAAEVFVSLLEARRRDVVPYLIRHVTSVAPRWGLVAQREAKGLPQLLTLAREADWLDLWAALIRTGGTKELFDGEVQRLVQSTALAPSDARWRLSLIGGPGREANLPGLSLASVHPLEEKTALELYARFPELVRGPYRMHVTPSFQGAYPRLLRVAIAAKDTELVDFMAANAAIRAAPASGQGGWKETIEGLTAYFEAMPEPEFVQRASNALSRMPAFAVWHYDRLLENNRLARLLFERSTTLYLSDGNAVRDLLESAQIHVQVLAFRILSRDDPRASAIAAENADLLQAALFRPLHRRSRLVAFRALENATRRDEATTRYLLGRMREALTLPERRYPTEQLVGLIGRVLHAWPSLRGPREVPRIYGWAGA